MYQAKKQKSKTIKQEHQKNLERSLHSWKSNFHSRLDAWVASNNKAWKNSCPVSHIGTRTQDIRVLTELLLMIIQCDEQTYNTLSSLIFISFHSFIL